MTRIEGCGSGPGPGRRPASGGAGCVEVDSKGKTVGEEAQGSTGGSPCGIGGNSLLIRSKHKKWGRTIRCIGISCLCLVG